MKNLLLLILTFTISSCINVAPEVDVDEASHEIVIVEFGELSFIDDDKTYSSNASVLIDRK